MLVKSGNIVQLEKENTEMMEELNRCYVEMDRLRGGLTTVMEMKIEPASDVARRALRLGHN